MINFNRVIKMLGKDEIKEIILFLEKELDARERKLGKFEFYFTASDVPRKYHPYVAQLYWNNGRLQRQFFSFKRSYHKDGTVSVYGTYEARKGAILEKRYSVDGRQWFLVTEEGKQTNLGYYEDKDNKEIEAAIEYLKGRLTLEEFEKKLFEEIFEESHAV